MTVNDISWMNTTAKYRYEIFQVKMFIKYYCSIWSKIWAKNARKKRKKMRENFNKKYPWLIIF